LEQVHLIFFFFCRDINQILNILQTAVQVNVHSAEYAELPKLMAQIIPTIISLGSDSDVLVRQLFQPLALQMIHYHTNQQKIDSKGTLILMNTIMVFICFPCYF